MTSDSLVFGLLNVSREIADPALAARARGLTISWSRFKYFGPILEDETVDGVLAQAVERGFRYCFLQSYGSIVVEVWSPQHLRPVGFLAALDEWIDSREFLIAGDLQGDGRRWYGLGRRRLLVDLDAYERLGRPAFGEPGGEPIDLPAARAVAAADGRIARLEREPSGGKVRGSPELAGWSFLRASLDDGLAVEGFDPAVRDGMLHLEPELPERAAELERVLGPAILERDDLGGGRGDRADSPWPPGEHRFLARIRRHLENSRRGVFVWNFESYEDVEEPPPDFEAPVTSLYSVAAGLKANRILATHGFDAASRVVFFDYSAQALEFKKLLVAEWDGVDYPRFLRRLFTKLPPGETFYWLWDDADPADLDWDDVERHWRLELETWGGEDVLREHWARYRELHHEFVMCNILSEQDDLLAAIEDQPNAVIWWSNAFFTVYSNWFYDDRERRRIYDRWIDGLAAKAPDIFLYGSDFNNISVNCVQAGDYRRLFRESGASELEPGKFHRLELAF